MRSASPRAHAVFNLSGASHRQIRQDFAGCSHRSLSVSAMKILVPTDGSGSALRAAKYAAALHPKGSVTLISVHDDTGLKHIRKFIPKDTVSDYLRELSDKDLKSARIALDKTNVPHDMVIKTGHVAEEIAKFAKVGKYDLIVMGIKGRSVVSDILIGSVAQRVLALTQLPLTFIK